MLQRLKIKVMKLAKMLTEENQVRWVAEVSVANYEYLSGWKATEEILEISDVEKFAAENPNTCVLGDYLPEPKKLGTRRARWSR
jgi:hypothetical protein